MTELLSKNLEYLKQQNDKLALDIANIKDFSANFEININLAGEYNLLIDSKPVHSLTGIEVECNELMTKLPFDEYNSIHVVYGLGLGYLADTFAENLKGSVVVFEPDKSLINYVFSVVDFTQAFETKKFYVVSDKNQLVDLLMIIFKFNSKSTLSLLDYYAFNENIAGFKEFLTKQIQLISHNYAFQVERTFDFMASTVKRLGEKYEYPFITDYKNVFKDKPAIIVSAGPSLSKNIETLKKYKDNAYIFCVGTAAGTLYKNDITPDFISVIELADTKLHYDYPFVKDCSILVEPFTEASYMDLPFKNKILTPSLETDAVRWFLETSGKPLVDFEAKGTVAYQALYSAYYLGCNPIILLGQDLAFSDGNCYAKNSKFDSLVCVLDENTQKYKIECTDIESYKDSYCPEYLNIDEGERVRIVKDNLKKLNDELFSVKGQDGSVLPTSAAYGIFIEYFQEFAKDHGEGKLLFNSSLGGAFISGFETLGLNVIGEKYLDEKILKEDFKLLNSKSNISQNTLQNNLLENINLLVEINEYLKEGKALATQCSESVNSEVLYSDKSKKMMNRLSELFVLITNKYMLNNKVMKIVSLKEYVLLNDLIRKNNIIDNKDIAKLYCDSYKTYFEQVFNKLNYVLYMIYVYYCKLVGVEIK